MVPKEIYPPGTGRATLGYDRSRILQQPDKPGPYWCQGGVIGDATAIDAEVRTNRLVLVGVRLFDVEAGHVERPQVGS